jgi:hypothetical protein
MVSQFVESYYGVRIRPSFENTRHDHAFVCIGKYQIVSHACAEQNPANRRITSDHTIAGPAIIQQRMADGGVAEWLRSAEIARRPKSLMSGR